MSLLSLDIEHAVSLLELIAVVAETAGQSFWKRKVSSQSQSQLRYQAVELSACQSHQHGVLVDTRRVAWKIVTS